MLSAFPRGGPRVGAARPAAESLVLPPADYPLRAERLAVLGVRLRDERNIRVYPHWCTADLEAWRPDALAGHRNELMAVGELRRRGFLALDELCMPIVVLTGLSEAPLSRDEHDRLWDLFGLPIFEQLRGPRHELFGWECDARSGYHLAIGAGALPKLTPIHLENSAWRGTELHEGECPCGEHTWRLTLTETATPLVNAAVAR